MPARFLISEKLCTVVLISGGVTALQTLFQEFIFDDWQYLAYLGILFTIDTITGFMKAAKNGGISSSGFGQIIRKMVSYFSVLILAHVMTNFKIDSVQVTIFAWVDDFAYISLILKEAISILENIAAINPAWVPRGLLKRLKEFDFSKHKNTDK